MKILSHGKSPDRLAVCLSDLHCGHRLGLLAPDTKLMEATQALGVTQRYLWALYQRQMTNILSRKQDVVLFVNGDLTHGLKYGEGCFTQDVYEQCLVATKCLEPWLERGIQTVRIIQGTASHTMEGATENIIADLLAANYPRADVGIVGHGLFDVEGRTFDIAHHGPSKGIREWTSGNQCRYYLRSLMLAEIGLDNEPPDWVVRSHYHSYLPPERVNAAGRTSEIVLTPSFCGMNGHGRQATRSQHVQTHGMVLWRIGEGGACQFEPMVETLDLRTVQRL